MIRDREEAEDTVRAEALDGRVWVLMGGTPESR